MLLNREETTDEMKARRISNILSGVPWSVHVAECRLVSKYAIESILFS